MQQPNRQQGKRKTKNSLANSTPIEIYGKISPSDIYAEKAILGAIMLQTDAFDIVSEIIGKDIFYVTAHQMIYSAFMSLQLNNQPLDIISVCNQLKIEGNLENVGGPYYVTQLTNSVIGRTSINHHCRIIFQKFIQRSIIDISMAMANRAYEDDTDVFDLLEEFEQSVLGLGTKHMHGEMISIDGVLIKAMTQISKWRSNEGNITGVPSGFWTIDRATRGWQNGDLIILAARPSVGKTALALALAKNATKSAVPTKVAIFSLEMDAVQLVLRMLADESETLLHRIQTGRMDDTQMENLYRKGIQSLAKNNIFFNDSPGLTLFGLRGNVRRLKKQHPTLGIIIIDYLQLMSGEGNGNREQEISSISRGLKALAREVGIPIIALSQLTRDVDNKGKPREPMISDLRESGAIEQDADVILLAWAPDPELVKQDASLASVRHIKIGKQRNGPLARAQLNFETGIQRIAEYEAQQDAKKQGNYTPVSDLFTPESKDLPI